MVSAPVAVLQTVALVPADCPVCAITAVLLNAWHVPPSMLSVWLYV